MFSHNKVQSIKWQNSKFSHNKTLFCRIAHSNCLLVALLRFQKYVSTMKIRQQRILFSNLVTILKPPDNTHNSYKSINDWLVSTFDGLNSVALLH